MLSGEPCLSIPKTRASHGIVVGHRMLPDANGREAWRTAVMPSMTNATRALAAAGLFAVLTSGLARSGALWADGQHAQVRLVPGGRDGAGELLAGIAISLDHGFKTYWRSPGESGLPPSFDVSGSTNLAHAEVLWPVPNRLEDAGGVAYGYKDEVTFPLRVVPEDATRPVDLRVVLAYGVCNDICIPARAEFALRLDGSDAPDSTVRAALARVPEARALGDAGPLSVQAVEPGGDANTLAVSVRAPPGETLALFIEAPDGWFILARDRPDPPRAGAPAGATGIFVAEILERPSPVAGPLELRLTLASTTHAIETATTLDTSRLSR